MDVYIFGYEKIVISRINISIVKNLFTLNENR